MTGLRILIAAGVFLMAAHGVAFSALYKWVDENGVVTYSDAPPPSGVKGGVVNLPRDSSGYSPTGGARPAKSTDYTKEPAGKRHEVELYVTSWCPYCKKAENYFRSRGIPFKSYDIEKDKRAARRKNQLDSRRGVPFAVVNGKKIHGYSEAMYQNALESGR